MKSSFRGEAKKNEVRSLRPYSWLVEFSFQVGYYKMHPEIPAEMSDRAKHFMMRCFEPDPDRRATSAELMEDNFLNEYRVLNISIFTRSSPF